MEKKLTFRLLLLLAFTLTVTTVFAQPITDGFETSPLENRKLPETSGNSITIAELSQETLNSALFSTSSELKTGEPAISEFPYAEGFETWPPVGWTVYSLDDASSWQQDDGTGGDSETCPDIGNLIDGSSVAMFDNYYYPIGYQGYLISPELDLSALTEPVVEFYWWNGASTDDSALLRVQTKVGNTAWELVEEVATYGSQTNGWVRSYNTIASNVTQVRLDGISDYGYHNTFVDGFVIREAPTGPIVGLNAEPLLFGEVPVGIQSSQRVTIRNRGVGTLTISGITLSGEQADQFSFVATPDHDLTANEELVIDVTFAPTTIGAKSATLHFTDNLSNSYAISLSGEGVELPQGSTCINPLPLEFPALNITGNTADYSNNYSEEWINPTSPYLDGYDVVYQFTLVEEVMLTGTITGSEEGWIGAFILRDEPNETTPAEVVLFKKSDSGTTLYFSNDYLAAGTYYLIISTWPTPYSTEYEINLTVGEIVQPEVTTYIAPPDETTDISYDPTLSWDSVTNAQGYKVYCSTDSTFADVTPTYVSETSYQLSNLDFSTTYYWKVIPYNSAGDASGAIEVWSFTTDVEADSNIFMSMPILLDLEGPDPYYGVTDFHACQNVIDHNDGNTSFVQRLFQGDQFFAIEFEAMTNITASSVISFDYAFLDYTTRRGIEFVADRDYLNVLVDKGDGYPSIVATINSTNHTTSDEMTNITFNIGEFAGEIVIFTFIMPYSGTVDYYALLDNLYFGEAPAEHTIPAGGIATGVLGGDNVEVEFLEPNSEGFSLDLVMVANVPSDVADASFLPRYWRINSSVANPGTYNITFDLAGLAVSNYNHVRFMKRTNSLDSWSDVVVDLGAILTWSGSKVTISGLDSFSEFIPMIDETLPVTLSAFNAVQTSNNQAQINWATASESGVLGYNLYRAETTNQDEAFRITANMIEASNEAAGYNYSYVDSEVEFDATYYYWLQTNDFDGTSEMFGPVSVKISTDEDNDIAEILLGTQLFANYPNPFNPSTTISFSVAEPNVVTINVYNIKGQLVQKLFDKRVDEINVKHSVVWNGKDTKGKNAASGIYFTIMKVGNKRFSNKAILLK